MNVHLVMEYLAFFIAFRYYLRLRRRSNDPIPDKNRLSILVGAIFGALAGSRIAGFIENPAITFDRDWFLILLNTKSIMGGLFGGLLGVEYTKKIIGERKSSGDLFTLPLVAGIVIGRVGCFLTGIHEFTYGRPTDFIFGMNLGDGLQRHPIALYEIVFLCGLFFFLYRIQPYTKKESGLRFKIFMLSYFAFRFAIEFLKPNVFYVIGLSSIQWLCVFCWTYYLPTIKKITKHAYEKIHVLRFYA